MDQRVKVARAIYTDLRQLANRMGFVPRDEGALRTLVTRLYVDECCTDDEIHDVLFHRNRTLHFVARPSKGMYA